jgi:hypothetical protein
VGAAPRGEGGHGGPGAVPERFCRPAAARPRQERAVGVCMRAVGAKQGRPESPISGPGAIVTGGTGQKWFTPFQNSNGSKMFNFFPNFDQSKFDLPELQKIKIKYGFEDPEKMNNFLYRNVFGFRRDLE